VAYRILAEPRYWHYLRFPLSVAAPAPVRLLEVDASEREIGQSKYGPYRLARLAVDAVLSLMPIRRLSVTLTALAVIGFTLAGDGHVVAGVALLAGTSWLAIRHRQLGRADVLRRMVAVESANVDRSLAKR